MLKHFFNRGKLYISMTVLPERLVSSFFQQVIQHLKNQSQDFDSIILSIPHIYKKTNTEYTLPQWVLDDPDIRINRCEDFGPATKILGFYHQLKPNDKVCIVDDDIIYLPDMLENLFKKHQLNPKALITTVKDQHGSPAGYGGYMFQKKHLSISDEDIADLLSHCYYVDDTWVGKICKNKSIPVLHLSRNWLASMDQALTDTHPDWFELCKNTDRESSIKKCLCENCGKHFGSY